jgi:hypothetical protein
VCRSPRWKERGFGLRLGIVEQPYPNPLFVDQIGIDEEREPVRCVIEFDRPGKLDALEGHERLRPEFRLETSDDLVTHAEVGPLAMPAEHFGRDRVERSDERGWDSAFQKGEKVPKQGILSFRQTAGETLTDEADLVNPGGMRVGQKTLDFQPNVWLIDVSQQSYFLHHRKPNKKPREI